MPVDRAGGSSQWREGWKYDACACAAWELACSRATQLPEHGHTVVHCDRPSTAPHGTAWRAQHTQHHLRQHAQLDHPHHGAHPPQHTDCQVCNLPLWCTDRHMQKVLVDMRHACWQQDTLLPQSYKYKAQHSSKLSHGRECTAQIALQL